MWIAMLVMAQRGFLCVFFLFLLLASPPHAAMLRWNLPAVSAWVHFKTLRWSFSYTQQTLMRDNVEGKKTGENPSFESCPDEDTFLALVLCRIRLVFDAFQIIAICAYPQPLTYFFKLLSFEAKSTYNWNRLERSTILPNQKYFYLSVFVKSHSLLTKFIWACPFFLIEISPVLSSSTETTTISLLTFSSNLCRNRRKELQTLKKASSK